LKTLLFNSFYTESSKLSIPVTFRATGTSLSGQAIFNSVLVIAGNHWKKYTLSEGGLKIRLQPGLTDGRVNALPAGRRNNFSKK
jgi:D-lactate dehydrogenase